MATNELSTSSESNWKEIDKIPVTSRGVFTFGDCRIELTNVEHQVWKGITKAELMEYYHSVADLILPYLKSRPLSLHLKPYAATAPGLYIKDMEGRQPDCADIYQTKRKHRKSGRRDIIDYLVCNNEATLLYMINLGCIDINPWNTKIGSIDQPDYIVIDLDPSKDDFSIVVRSALAAKKVFDKLGLHSFIKTSGKTGMHLFLPCEGFGFREARSIAENICRKINALIPDITTTAVSISERGDSLYLDPNQNDETDTIASVYSVRPYKIPAVSTPLQWNEVNDDLNPADFTIDTIQQRLSKKGDLWKDLQDKEVKSKNSLVLKGLLLD